MVRRMNVLIPQRFTHPTIVLTRGDTIKPEPIRWLWNGWLAAGKFHILAGAPGTGKTTIALAMIATITKGGLWPDGTQAKLGRALVWSGEDSPKDTLVPRLLAMGADMSRILFIEGRRNERGEAEPFDPATDVPLLGAQIAEYDDIRLLIVDPIVSAVGGDSHKNAETRRSLQPLVDLGKDHDCAILGINHFSKGTANRDPTERVTGSLAFGALARVVLVTVKRKDEDGNESRVIARAKSNVGPDTGGFVYDLSEIELPMHPGVFTSVATWGAPIEGDAREILSVAEESSHGAESSLLSEAKEWLSDFLCDSPRLQKDIKEHSNVNGIAWKTIRNAKSALNIASTKASMSGGWVWSLPECAHKNAKVPYTNEGASSGNQGHLEIVTNT